MNERQLSLFLRHAFSLVNAENGALKGANPAFVRAMQDVKLIVDNLPEGSLRLKQTWQDLEPSVMRALRPYNDAFRDSLFDKLPELTADIENEVIDMLSAVNVPNPIGTAGQVAGAPTDAPFGLNRQLAETSQQALARTSINNVNLAKLFELSPTNKGPVSMWMRENYRAIDRVVQTGILQGASTEAIAKQISQEASLGGLLKTTKGTAAGSIKAQANTIARTAVQSFNTQVTQRVWAAQDEEVFEGLVYEWTAALDARVCPTCGPLDGRKEKERRDLPPVPIHPNCRCQVVLSDPDDDDDVRTGIQLSREKPTGLGAYASKVKVDGKSFYRKAVEIKKPGATYADYLADLAKKDTKNSRLTLAEYFGGAGRAGQGESTIGVARADWFRKAVTEKNVRPDKALLALVTKPNVDTRLRTFRTPPTDFPGGGSSTPKPKAPKPTPPPKPAPKPKVVATPAAPKQAQSIPKAETFTPLEKLTNEQMVSELEKKWDIPVPKGLRDERQLLADQLADMRGVTRLGSSRLGEIDELIEKNKSLVSVSKPREVSGNTRLAREFNDAETVLGKGTFGEARLTSKGDVIKTGAIGQDEVKAMQRLERSGISPVLKDAEAHTDLVLGGGREADGASAFIGKYNGMLKMSRAKGQPMLDYVLDGEEKTTKLAESFLRSSKKMHLQGVAHNDRHMQNIFVDDKNVSFLDFGLAQTDSRAALVEALGNDDPVFDRQGGDLFLTNNLGKSSVWQVFRKNKASVIGKLKASSKGSKLLKKEIRTSGETLSELISEKEAQALLVELYEGI